MGRLTTIGAVGVATVLAATLTTPGTAQARHTDPDPRVVVGGLDGPRGVDTLGKGRTLVSESDGSFSLVIERRKKKPAKVVRLGAVPGSSPAVAAGRKGRVYVLAGVGGEPGGPPVPGESTLYEWRPGWAAPKARLDLVAYQAKDPDPYDLENLPGETNPFGIAALRDGSVLIADAANNDLVRWWPNGRTVTVARLKTRVVEGPPELGLPGPVPSEAVPTSVAVGPDGYWYVGELRGFPATPGTSQVWRIKPGTVNATCDPEKPRRGPCRRYADGLTSIVDLAGTKKSVYAVSMSKLSWLAAESDPPIPGAEIGGLYRITKAKGRTKIRELAAGKLVLPGGVDVGRKGIYVTGPLFGEGSLSVIR
ncbi:ScyD/ScyE family protein [Nocardioides sp. zg-536]|uniref:ScyD/ScyE family protein n=1 Tax=Nocardioides faecalis TaxID=2803858 RepID=A0A939BZC9_9ACTN|nr:ScyD/ScyE family protein [Nocardioides faecalis]MBM9460915.1 ScyD/ScyE family protein [Nocardioides faecalis]MBS4751890.1 ScyD/ScyE family protein [Nocardioides faecalis]QVI59260.1 ScyD/ScyE family protein [Nocardioides faecalis]